ncbi:EGF-like repeat and discoidin I-like domain-containing protein 3 isoform X2 [Denticeps clupeoides]|uniref:EGF-like repeat and discoidin I-like domain-containing protein 3 isoform X2 n=1 Tax=Denticeps clupeoides TaxID=299321 RepID=UPI0010A471C3|nr:EGF-like repeat and discoidin I-like domain-containing protein 3 isoform X2 [Denticeps clupeoides]
MLPFLLLATLGVGTATVPRPTDGDVCEPVPCENGADCFSSAADEGVSSSEREGGVLEVPCIPSLCHNGGTCEFRGVHRGDSFVGYHCKCLPGFDGDHCQHNMNECESSPCRNGGICTDLVGNYTCVCPAEFMGRNCQYKCSGPLGMEGGIISNQQITASSTHRSFFQLQKWYPYFARLNKKGLVNAWSAAESDRWPWIQINLQRRMRVTGLVTQGAKRVGIPEYVKSYKVAFSEDGENWIIFQDKDKEEDMLFRGNVDNNTPYGNSFTPPIEAQYIRIHPQVCRKHCTLRMELLGCELTGCSEPLGKARLDEKGKVNAWASASNDQSQWLQVDLLLPTKVTGIITQGAKDFGRVQFVGSYKLSYSNDGEKWAIYQDEKQQKDKIFQGNFDNETHRKNVIDPPIYARFVRIVPWSWYGRISLRVELLGCTEEDQ